MSNDAKLVVDAVANEDEETRLEALKRLYRDFVQKHNAADKAEEMFGECLSADDWEVKYSVNTLSTAVEFKTKTFGFVPVATPKKGD